MKKIDTIEQGVKSALELYEKDPCVKWNIVGLDENRYTDGLILEEKEYPLFWWREDAQVSALIDGAPSRKTCSIKINSSVKKSYGLKRLMYREFDIAEQIARSTIAAVTCFINGKSANIIATMANGIVACFELAACLNEQTDDQGRRSFWGQNGMMSDRIVSHKLSGEEIYLFTDDKKTPETFTDLFIHMYGLDKEAIYKSTYVARVLMNEIDISNVFETDDRLKRCVKAAFDSAETGSRIYLNGGERC